MATISYSERTADLRVPDYMKPAYHEVQHFSPRVIGTTVLISLAALIAAGMAAAAGWSSSVLIGLLLAGVAPLGWVLALGRLRIHAEDGLLEIRLGWLGLGRTLDLGSVARARVCLRDAAAAYSAWGWHWGGRGSRNYCLRNRRGVEIIVSGQRMFIGSPRPQRLKDALVGPDPASVPEYRREQVVLPSRRRAAAGFDWSRLPSPRPRPRASA